MNKDEQLAITKYDLLYEQRMTMVEASCQNLEKITTELITEVKEIRRDMKTDFRWILGMMLALAGLMAKGFHWF